MTNTKKIGIVGFGIMLLFFGASNAQSISLPNNIYANTTFPIIVNGLQQPNATNFNVLEINISGNIYPVLYVNTTAEFFGYLNATGSYPLSVISLENGSIIASTTINVSANPIDIIGSNQIQDQENITNLTNNINGITDSLNNTNNSINNLNTSFSAIQTSTSNSINSITASLDSGLNTMNGNSNLFSAEIANNTQLETQTASLLNSYINNTDGELSQVATDLVNLNTTTANINSTHNNNELLLFVGEIALLATVAYIAFSLRARKGKQQNNNIEQEIEKEMARETKKENEMNNKERLQASRFEALKKKKNEIQRDGIELAMQNDAELDKLKADYLSVKDGAIKNKIPPQSLPEFMAYRNYAEKKYGVSIDI